MEQRFVYADHSATTGVRPEVLEAMLPYLKEEYGNPSSIYKKARSAKEALEKARGQVAKAIGAKNTTEVFFTGSGTEADNWALKGIFEAYANKGNHIITTAVEHHAILHTCDYLEKVRGAKITYLPVDAEGFVKLDELEKSITDETILVSIIAANNEIGTINPIEEISRICHEKGVLLHIDAVQAIGNIPIDVEAMGIDLLSISAHKFYAPKGVGALYVRKGVRLPSFIHGGDQERKKRAATENIPGIVGMGVAIELAVNEMEERNKTLIPLRDRLIREIEEKIPFAKLNGPREKRLPGHVNFSFEFIEGESLLLLLDMAGICASSGSACTSGSLDPSHVLMAIGLPHEIAHGSLRLTLGRENTEEDVDYIMEKLPPIVERLREMSPLYEDFVNGNVQPIIMKK
ncbi:MAG: cysteine desulfurase NifS [Firmicutes bacterium]|nr:cysteine desulfurase NifS [Bacillota bacterium]